MLSPSFSARSIPTCVGASETEEANECFHKVYPHVCGGISLRASSMVLEKGLSPRVWGHLTTMSNDAAAKRSIPTCVGASVF